MTLKDFDPASPATKISKLVILVCNMPSLMAKESIKNTLTHTNTTHDSISYQNITARSNKALKEKTRAKKI